MTFDKRLFSYLAIGFMAVTVIGTLTHELGHYTAAKYLGYEADINYAYAYWSAYAGQAVKSNDAFLITLAGPAETILTGTTGLVLLFGYRRNFASSQTLTFRQWTIVFITLFWLRQTVNFFVWTGGFLLTGRFSADSDETRIANYLALPCRSLSFITAVIGICVLVIVLRCIPAQQRLTFLSAGMIGGATGYVLWLHLLGPVLMP